MHMIIFGGLNERGFFFGMKRSPLYLWERARVRVVNENKFYQNSADMDHY